jgi:hypothetical protein
MFDKTVKSHLAEMDERSLALKKQEEKWIAEMAELKKFHNKTI